MAKFLGLNTVDRVRAPFTLVDSDLVKRDLMNEFYTKKGERVMRPIWQYYLGLINGPSKS